MSRQTMLHFLRSYIAFLLGLLLLLLPLYYGTISLFENRQLELTGNTLENGLSSLDQQITGLSGIALSVGQNPSYRVLAQRSLTELTPAEYYSMNTLHTEFRRLCLAQPYVKDYGLLLRNHILFTKERIYPSEADCYGTFITFDGIDKEQFYDIFGSISGTSQFLPEMSVLAARGESITEEYKAIIWLCSMSQAYVKHPVGIFYATISTDTLTSLLIPGLNTDVAGFTLCTKAGQTLTQVGQWQGQKDDHILTRVSSQAGLTITLIISSKLFTDMMAPIRHFLLLCFLGLLLVGLALAAWLATRSSRPISHLVQMVTSSENAAAYQGNPKNSFELLGNVVMGLDSSVAEYRTALSAQQESVRAHVFETMLRETPIRDGAVSDRHIREFNQCYPSFPIRYRLALFVLPRQAENSLEDLPKYQLILRRMIESCLSPTPTVYFSGQKAIAALPTDTGADWPTQLDALRIMTKEQFHIILSISLSDEGSGCAQMHAMYQQARNLLQLAGDAAQNDLVGVWQRQNFPDQQETFPFDYAEMAQLYTLLLHGEKKAVLSLLTNIRNELRLVSVLDEVMVRQVFYNIRGVLLRVKAERYEPLLSLDVPDYHDELGDDALLASLENRCATICDILSPLLSSPQAAFSGAVCKFVDEHLSDSSLCARLVADRFAISEPTLQKLVRQEKNCSFFDYVEKQRYALALTLLKESEETVTAIALKCGYNSPNSFYKAFKRMSSDTPAAVRQMARIKKQ